MYCIYILKPEINKLNFFGGTRRLNMEKWWMGTTGIMPIDDIIKNKIVKYAYVHHIERLMYLGAFMMMLGVRPNDIYKIFMEWTIDAYEWVMVPNIYGMSQFADGGKVMRRPYLSSSNYIIKMSDYGTGAPFKANSTGAPFKANSTGAPFKANSTGMANSIIDWRNQWDALYYAFIWHHHKFFAKSYNYAVQVKNYMAKTAAEKRELNKLATEVIANLTKKN
jgi:deoxyribodipyrimidine photolyase-related protein